ncbi:MAG: YHYH domain-containing protein [Clostridia bacterium]|nr:YHYH domain-containing protein [Clostridia bacterium]
MKKLLSLFLTLQLLFGLSVPCFAHPGKTDSNGGHWDHSTGTYHYHHGYPAHDHVDGVCPYDFDDKTDHSSRSSSGSTS